MKTTEHGPDLAHLKELIDSLPALIHTSRPDGHLDFFNQRWLEFVGLRLEDLEGWKWTAAVHEDDVTALVARWRTCLVSGEPFVFEGRVRRADGEYRWMLHQKVAVRDEGGRIVKWYGSSIDIEDRKEAEERVCQQERELRQIVDLVPHHVSVVSPDGTGLYGNEVMLDYYGLTLEDLTGPVIRRFAHPDDVDAFTAAWQRGFTEAAAWEAEARFRRRDGEYRWFLVRVTPLRNDAGQIVRWYATGTDIDERKRAEEALRDSEERYRALIEVSPQMVWMTRADGANIYMNQWAYDYMGLAQAESEGLGWAQVVHPDHQDRVVDLWLQAAAAGGEWIVETPVRRAADGQYRWHFCRGLPVRDADGGIVRWVGIAIDIHDRREAEEALRRSEAWLSEAQRLSRTGSWVMDLETSELKHWSSELLRICGFDLDAGIPSTEAVRERTHPKDRAKNAEEVETAIRERTGVAGERRLVLPDGKIRHLQTVVSPVFDAAGHPIEIIGTAMDVTERKRAEEALRESEERYRALIEVSPQMVWMARADGSNIFWNQWWYDYTGLTRAESEEFGWVQALHPEHRDRHVDLWVQALASGVEWNNEALLRRADGQYRWHFGRGLPIRDADGRIVRWMGIGIDIHDRREAEERVRQDERELRTIVDFLPELLVVGDANGLLGYANRAALEFTGRTLEETLGRPDVWSEIVHPDDLLTVVATIRGLAEGIGGEVEFRLRRADGQYRWMLGRSAPLRDAEGRVIGWFSTGTDIDDRKRAEQRMRDENLALREEVDKASMFEEIVGTSSALRAVLTSVAQVAPTDSTVLITGETGTGKELVARAIHKRSQRASRAFVSVNCAAIPPTLIASELFGHEKGAFTGALQRRAGRFELADGGTIFLDEVGDLPTDTQLALLRVLQEREFERVGSTRPIKVDVRVIAATNRDLNAAIEGDAFRTDLFYRLNVFPIEVPPLRERPSDISLLVAYFVERYARNVGKTIRHVEKRTLELVQSYRWPGNVRELQNVIERAVIICESETLKVDPRWLARQTAPERVRPLADELAARERQMIETALAESNGRVSGPTGAAARLGMPSSTLESKIRALGISKHHFKGS